MSLFWTLLVNRHDALTIVHIDRVLQINRTDYERSPRLLLSVVAVEAMINLCLLAFLPVFCNIVWKSGNYAMDVLEYDTQVPDQSVTLPPYSSFCTGLNTKVVHRNFRLQLCTSAVYYALGSIGRAFTFHAQYTGKPDEEVVTFLMPALFARVAGTIFAESLILCFALERTVATFRWSWYERGSAGTLIIWLAVEGVNLAMFALNTYLKYNVSLEAMFAHNALIPLAGFLWFWLIYRKNLRELARINAGAQVGSYSVARTFQVKENAEVLRYMSWMGRGWILATCSTSISYGYYAAGPRSFEVSRALSYNLFEMCIAGHFVAFYGLSISGNKHIHKQFRELRITRAAVRILKKKEITQPPAKAELRSETDHYFSQLSESWR